MSTINAFIQSYDFNRKRTLALLDAIIADENLAALAWRPGSGRAHIAWQLMHIGITEEIFATERLAPNRPIQFGRFGLVFEVEAFRTTMSQRWRRFKLSCPSAEPAC